MDEFKAVRGSSEISRSMADLLEKAAPAEYHGGNRTQTLQSCNDVLQGRSELSLDMLHDLLEQKCGPHYADELAEVRREVAAFYQQRMLRTRQYDRTGDQVYDYRIWDFDPRQPLKIIDQAIYDDAVKQGFPPDFFTRSYFDCVTVYCLPDWADCSHSRFDTCCFSVCGIRGAVFDNTRFYNTDFHSSLLQNVNFTGAGLTHCHFRDCDFLSVSFQDARLRLCWMLDCSMNHVSFQNAALDGTSFGRISARRVFDLYTASITQGGATEEEVRQLRDSVYRELGLPVFPEKKRTPTLQRGKAPVPGR